MSIRGCHVISTSRVRYPETGIEVPAVKILFIRKPRKPCAAWTPAWGREYDGHSACMAASAACLAKGSGLSRIDHGVLSVDNGTVRKGENLFVVQSALNDPAHDRAHMKTQDAVNAPVDQSLAKLQALDETQQRRQIPAMDEPHRQMTSPMRMGRSREAVIRDPSCSPEAG